MGLISFIKNLYYEIRLDKADELLSKGHTSEAENIYSSILDKQPMAAARLASYYHSLSQNAYAEDAVQLFGKAVEIESKGGMVYDTKAYNEALNKFAYDLFKRAQQLFNSSSYATSSLLLAAINKTKCKTASTSNLGYEAETNIILQKIKNTPLGSNEFAPLMERLKTLWNLWQHVAIVKQTITEFCDKLVKARRHYAAAIIIGMLHNNKYHKECLKNIAYVINGEDIDAGPTTIGDIIANYGKILVSSNDYTDETAVELFNKCWKLSLNHSFVITTLRADIEISRKNSIVEHIISQHQDYLSDPKLYPKFINWIGNTYSNEDAIRYYERIHNLGYNVKHCYTNKIHAISESQPIDARIQLLDKAQQLYPDSDVIIGDKLACAKWYETQGNNETAIKIADSIIPQCKEARIVKAKAMCNLANKETDVDKKVQHAEKAAGVLKSQRTAGAAEVKKYIHQTLLSAAEQYYWAEKSEKCYPLLDKLAEQGCADAVTSMTSFRITEINNCPNASEKRSKAEKTISKISSYLIPNPVKTTLLSSLWSEKINAIIEECKNLEYNIALSELEKLKDEIKSSNFTPTYICEKEGLVNKNIIEIKYTIAKDLERNNNYDEAISVYKQINTLEGIRASTQSAHRLVLCRLKREEPEYVQQNKRKIYSILKKSAKAFKAEKDDIAYRFALALLKANEDEEALAVLSEFLPGEVRLKKVCRLYAIARAQKKLENFNQTLAKIDESALSSRDAIYFVDHLPEYAEAIKPLLELSQTKLKNYKTKVNNYIIFKLFEDGKFDTAFKKMLKEHPGYLNDLTTLRNIALLCLNIVEKKQLDAKNYKDVISVWLTAIYQEKLFVKSLDYTSWDNQYRFTLHNAYGHYDEFAYESLPENVNFNFPEENVIISIREVQRTLLDRFEAAISETQIYHDFFTSQKDAMDALIALNLEKKCTIVAPHLAKTDKKVYAEIKEALNHEVNGVYTYREDILAVGIPYQMNDDIYTKYKTAKKLNDDIKKAIDTRTNNKVITLNNFLDIYKFSDMHSSLMSYISSKVAALKNDRKTIFKSNFNFYIKVCSEVIDKRISFSFSNYVMNHVVDEVNNDNMSYANASKYILPIFILDTSNSRVKENLTILFERMIRERTAENEATVNDILDRVQIYDNALYKKLKSEYIEVKLNDELNEVVDKVNNNTMSATQALQKVLSIYENNRDNSRVCENLAQLCNMCIMKYIIHKEYGGSAVPQILDKLLYDMSPTFKRYKSTFDQSYRNIWGQLPAGARLAIQGNNPNATLNESGLALKKGLDYYKKFAGTY